MPSFSTRCIFLFGRGGRGKRFFYEERITLWRAREENAALQKAEKEAKQYAKSAGGRYLGFIQCFRLFDKVEVDGVEVFSLVRESGLPPTQYLDRYFDTGAEMERKC
jgi:hypothetical protein